MKIFTTEDIRAIDRMTIEQDGISSHELIERVADGVVNEITTRWRSNKPTAVFAGSGNNGADALAVARRLAHQGFKPEVFLFNIGGNRLSKDCKDFRDELLATEGIMLTEVTGELTLPALNSSYLVIDGLFGSGLREPLTGGFMSLVRYINESKATVVSIDVPSGMFSDWNKDSINRNIIHAHLTLTLQFPRLAFLMKENAPLVGEWKVLDIGLSPEAIRKIPTNFHMADRIGIKRLMERRPEFCSKADFGSALIIAGSYGMMGAAVLAARGACRSGAGKVTIHSTRWGYEILQTSVPEAMFEVDKHDFFISNMHTNRNFNAIGIGPGIGGQEVTINALEAFLKTAARPVVLDADALNCISQRSTMLNHIPKLSIITPHAGEFDRLFGVHSTDEERLLTAIKKSEYYRIIILLKGHYTTLVRPDGLVYFNSSGTPALATAGSGDVLTGLITGLLAQGYKPEVAPLLGAYIHGVAGEIAAETHSEYGVTAGDIADNIGRAIKQIMQH